LDNNVKEKIIHEISRINDLSGEPEMMAALELIREIHAIRLKLQEETVGMTAEEYNKRAEISLAKRGISLCYDLSGTGKLKPRKMVTR